jgi:hypothetical protein
LVLKESLKFMIQFFSFLILFSLIQLNAEEIRFLYAHSLDGNLIACTCTRIPIAGLSRRDSFLKGKNLKTPSTLSLELGNFSKITDTPSKRQAILEGLETIGTDIYFPGKQELESLGPEDWKQLQTSKIVLSNLKAKSFFGSSQIFASHKTLKVKNQSIFVTGILSQPGFSNLPSNFRSKYKWEPIEDQMKKISKEDTKSIHLIGLIGDLSDFESYADQFPKNRVLFLIPFKKVHAPKGYLESKSLGKVYTTSGKNGDDIGMVDISIETLSPKSTQVWTIDIENWPDTNRIQKIAQKWGMTLTP